MKPLDKVSQTAILCKMWNRALKTIQQDKKQRMRTWLDKHPGFLMQYLETTPPAVLDKLGVYVIDKSLFSTGISLNNRRLDQIGKKRQLTPIPENILKEADEGLLFMQLVKDISDELDVDVLCHKILRNVSILTKSDRGSLFLVRGTGDQKYLVSRLFDVTQTTTFEEIIARNKPEIQIPFGKGIAGIVAQTKEAINIPEAYNDPRFNKEVDIKTGYRTHSILCMPVLDNNAECIAVAEIINKCNGRPHDYSQKDVDVFRRYLMFCGIGLTNAHMFEVSLTEFRRNQILLNLARHIFTEQTNLEKLIEKILRDAQKLVGSDRSAVFLLKHFEESYDGFTDYIGVPNYDYSYVDDDGCEREYKHVDAVAFSTVFDMKTIEDGERAYTVSSDIKQSPCVALAREVVVSKKAMHMTPFQMQYKFARSDFARDGDIQLCILTVPIFNSRNHIIGVMQQKSSKPAFEEGHEKLIDAFSVFTGLGIHNCIMYEHVCKLMAKQKVSLEIMSYHASASPDETQLLIKSEIPEAHHWNLYSFMMDDIDLDEFELAMASVRMFLESKVLTKYKVSYNVLCRWVLSVKKNYRPVIYHNWRHAFNVSQSIFAMLYTGQMIEQFDDLEVFGFLVACLCHDLDHRGQNNAFQVKIESALADLYSTSVMEHHHFNQCVMLLHTEGNNIFATMCSSDYRTVLCHVEHFILSTDLLLFFQKRAEFFDIIDNGNKDFRSPERKRLLSGMMMTAADLSAMYKPWNVSFRTSKQVVGEFFQQGDLERKKLGMDPIDMMDRNKKAEMPRLQMEFFDAVCVPLYEAFYRYDSHFKTVYESCKTNRMEWDKLVGSNVMLDLNDSPVSLR